MGDPFIIVRVCLFVYGFICDIYEQLRPPLARVSYLVSSYGARQYTCQYNNKTYKKTCATSQDSDQTAHPRSLIRVFADHMRLSQPPAIQREIMEYPYHTGWLYKLICVFVVYTGLTVAFLSCAGSNDILCVRERPLLIKPYFIAVTNTAHHENIPT